MGLTQITTGGVDDNINIDSNTLKVDGSNNRVGIGTSSPSAKLHVSGSAGDFKIESDGATLNFTRNGANYIQAAAASATLNYRSSQHIFTGSSLSDERMRIDSSGNVGIGTSSPARILHTSGDIVRFDNGGASAILLLDTTNNEGFRLVTNRTSGAFSIEDMGTAVSGAGTERLVIDSSGKINIGTTSATQKVSVGTSASETIGYSVDWTGAGAGQVASFTANTSTGEVRIGATNSAGTYFPTFYSNNSERMRIDSSGRLLVGTTSASGDALLQVAGPIQTGEVRTAHHSRSYTASTSSTNLFLVRFTSGHGCAEFTWFYTDSSYPNGARVGKIFMAVRGSGSNIIGVTISSSTEASNISGTFTTIAWSAAKHDNSHIVLKVTGSTTSGNGTIHLYGVSPFFDSTTPITDA